MKRRTVLSRSVAALALAVAGSAPATGEHSDFATATRETYTLLPDTDHATTVHVIEGSEPGPTAMVTGGVHGDETSGLRAAENVASWDIARGTLVVVPRVNVVAIERGTREGTGGDLNRLFPPGEEPESKLARGLWAEIERHDPDVFMDLHRSLGIYGVQPGYVGQAIFPSAAGDAQQHARAVAELLNDEVVPWYMPLHKYHSGGPMPESGPLIANKVGQDLDTPAYVVESTSFLLDLPTRTAWTTRAAAELLERHGIERINGD
ncbi:succinylglutamate desuccinylase/aspartoacylase family protein [Haladaptatus sp. YSMS36]|uniref:succinylglutamate desuccinylase/aspartoacylase family protein n=1 Tax=Haladaptatus sp. YSMS36 TaxID=3033384 RepID=UPI0023E7A07C|nr:succinylglutamate desuccinylase/aspartoacylase family protein [Haladaptatus sp. YSMS36]